MSFSQRSPRRVLGFEQLEAKTSPTPAFVDVGWTAEAAVERARDTTDGLLRYVATTLTTISIERSVPAEEEATAADQLLASHRVPAR